MCLTDCRLVTGTGGRDWLVEVEGGSGSWSETDVGMGGGGEGSLLVAVGWLAGLVGGVSIGWQYCCSASVFSSMVFMAGAGGGEREGDVCCPSCRLEGERVGEDWLVATGGSGLVLFADWTPSNCSPP